MKIYNLSEENMFRIVTLKSAYDTKLKKTMLLVNVITAHNEDFKNDEINEDENVFFVDNRDQYGSKFINFDNEKIIDRNVLQFEGRYTVYELCKHFKLSISEEHKCFKWLLKQLKIAELNKQVGHFPS
jgi:hypothetical protein